MDVESVIALKRRMSLWVTLESYCFHGHAGCWVCGPLCSGTSRQRGPEHTHVEVRPEGFNHRVAHRAVTSSWRARMIERPVFANVVLAY